MKMKEFHHIVLFLLLILVSVYGKFLVLGPGDPVVAIAGDDVLLDCQLVPDISASNMVVRWLKSGLDLPVHVYRNGEDETAAQHKDYRGRTELFKDELTKGNVSLRIKNTRIIDAGTYTCLVDDKTDNEETAVRLDVLGLGCEPSIQIKRYHKYGIQLVCKSSGWYPEPEIQWIGEDGYKLIQAETRNHQDSKGFVTVQSNIEITRDSTNRFKCLIRSKLLKTEQEAIIRISDDIFPVDPAWLVLLPIILCLLIAAVSAVIYWSVKQHRCIKELKLQKFIIEFDQWKPLVESEWKRICKVSVTLDDETTYPRLEVSEDRKSMRWNGPWRNLPDIGKRFLSRPCVLGSQGFTSGRHYWEVEVAGNQCWNLGVVAESVERRGWIVWIPGDGFWTIRRNDDYFCANTFPESPLRARPIPGKVGIYLSYESGTVSFFSADTKSHLYSFTGIKFRGKLYPFFYTREKKQWMKICSGSDLVL
ncbi:butyrophilin subfamily 1 member A1-like [Heptranchias perlo]|uniref:butyrophilin subfamily 1 member A1-like n=1 Tax=Heptranchias perlo TaxID=212740 RepID=UPI0035595A54